MGVNTQGCAGHQSDKVAARHRLQLLGVFRFNDFDLSDSIAQGLIEDFKGDFVPLDDLVELGKHFSLCQTSVPGQDRTCTDAADRQGRAFQMPNAFEKGFITRPVVDGKVCIDCGDLDTTHEPSVADVEERVVVEAALILIPRSLGDIRIRFE